MKIQKKLQFNLSSFILILTLIFSTLVFSGVESIAETATAPSASAQVGTQEIPANSKIFAPQATTKPATQKPQVSPIKTALPLKKAGSTTSHKKLFRFLEAMLGVLLSALVIFGVLKLYNFFVLKNSSHSNDKSRGSSLETPKTFKETINLFLDKTNK